MTRIALPLLAASLALTAAAGPVPGLTAAQIVEKNVAARGGLDAWRKVQTMAWLGHIERGDAPGAPLPFVLELKRPNKTRFEIHAQNQKSVRLYDGDHGWKLRPTSSGYPDLQPYTPAELAFAHDGQGVDGPLMDFRAKGVSVTLEGLDEIEGKPAYRLSVTLSSGASHHVWIDAKSFLEIKSDREARNAVGMSGTVSVYYRDYRATNGLQIPYVIESGGGASKTTDRMVIDKVALNPPLEDWMFSRPRLPHSHRSAGLGSPRAAWPGSADAH